MEERTFIPQVDCDCLYIQLAKCEVYEDAKKLLNTFILDFIKEHGGEVYDGGFDYDEHENVVKVKYQNSKTPKDVKRAVFDALIKEIDKCELLAKEVLGRLDEEIIKKDWQFITKVRNSEKDTYRVRRWAEAWQKEPVPIIKKEEYRLHPKDGKEHYIDTMFVRLQELGYLSIDENKDKWRYLCGTNDVVPSEPIKWLGSFFDFCVLFDFFLVSSRMSCIFGFEKGVQGFVVSMFGYEADTFKSRLSRDYKPKPEKDKKEIWNKMKDPQMLFT